MRKKITSDHFKQVKMLSHLEKMGDAYYFLVKQANMEENCYDSDLYRLKDGQVTRLTASKKVNQFYCLEGSIVFPGIREKKDEEDLKAGKQLTVWYRLTPEMGEAMEWKRLAFSVMETAFIDSDHFFFVAPYSRQWEELLTSCGGDEEKALKKKKEEEEFRVFQEIPFWSNGAGDTDGVRFRLYYYHGGKCFPVSAVTDHVAEIRLSPGKKTLAYTRSTFIGKETLENQLMTISVQEAAELAARTEPSDWEEGAGKTLAKGWDFLAGMEIFGISFQSEEKAVLTVDRMETYGLNENAAFYLWDLEKETVEMVYNGDPYTDSASEGSDCRMGTVHHDLMFDEEGFSFIGTVIHHTPIVHVSYTGQAKELTGMEMVMEAIPEKEGFTAIAMVGDDCNEIYQVSKEGVFTPLTAFNSHLTREYEVNTPIPFTFTNENGLEMTGWVIPPAGMEKGKKYPSILDVHGGPKTVYGPHFFHEMQYWSNEGFAVLFTNPTGGDGRGNAFADIRGKYGSVDYRDLMTFVDEALKKFDFLDPDRMGVTGGSYGGFMTNWIIGHTDRFKAAASQRSISSWLSFANTSDIGFYFSADQNGTTPWEDYEKLWDHSPLKYADRVKTPTLFLHSDEDTRCWMVEGIQMFYALKNFGIPARLVLFHQETHELSRSGRPKSRIRRNEEILNWMKKYL